MITLNLVIFLIKNIYYLNARDRTASILHILITFFLKRFSENHSGKCNLHLAPFRVTIGQSTTITETNHSWMTQTFLLSFSEQGQVGEEIWKIVLSHFSVAKNMGKERFRGNKRYCKILTVKQPIRVLPSA